MRQLSFDFTEAEASDLPYPSTEGGGLVLGGRSTDLCRAKNDQIHLEPRGLFVHALVSRLSSSTQSGGPRPKDGLPTLSDPFVQTL